MKLEINGDVLERGDEAYEALRQKNFSMNTHCRDNTSPACIVKPITIVDVQDSVKYAKEQNMKVVVRTGGHNWFGCFLRQDTMLIDMSNFNSMDIDIDAQTAIVGPNCQGVDINNAVVDKGLCFSCGHCVGVPVG